MIYFKQVVIYDYCAILFFCPNFRDRLFFDQEKNEDPRWLEANRRSAELKARKN